MLVSSATLWSSSALFCTPTSSVCVLRLERGQRRLRLGQFVAHLRQLRLDELQALGRFGRIARDVLANVRGADLLQDALGEPRIGIGITQLDDAGIAALLDRGDVLLELVEDDERVQVGHVETRSGIRLQGVDLGRDATTRGHFAHVTCQQSGAVVVHQGVVA